MKFISPHPFARRLIPAIVCFLTAPLLAATYHVDSAKGSDQRSGLSPAESWKTLEKVNATAFQPGDRIVFAAGGRWQGMLHPKGSGAKGNPIAIGRYGEGAKPFIDGAGATVAAMAMLLPPR